MLSSLAAGGVFATTVITSGDAMMDQLDREHPGYGFASHKGYPTPEHKAAVVKLGVCTMHRMSFPALHELQGEFSPLFYSLRDQLYAAADRAALGAFEAGCKAQCLEMEEREWKKLKLLISRRWKAVA